MDLTRVPYDLRITPYSSTSPRTPSPGLALVIKWFDLCFGSNHPSKMSVITRSLGAALRRLRGQGTAADDGPNNQPRLEKKDTKEDGPIEENPKDKKTNGKSMKKYIDDLANIKQATAENTHDETLSVDEIVRIGNA
ncbi:hypothetical protein PG987_004766 [Apiospora arundinis]